MSSSADHLDLNAAAAADPQILTPPPPPKQEPPPPKRSRGRPRKTPLPPPPPPPEGISYPALFQDEAKEGFAAGDLVWGKVRSKPWWPGQVFDAATASEAAAASRREGAFLVAFFGDKSFGWNDAAGLRPYATHFPKMARQSGGAEAFAAAVDASLAEVARRVQAAMACGRVDAEGVSDVAFENEGVREGTRVQAGNCSLIKNSFVPGRFLAFVQGLAANPGGSIDRLELVVAKAHSKAFDCWRGFPDPPEFPVEPSFIGGEVVVTPAPVVDAAKKSKADVSSSSTPSKRGRKRSHNPQDDSDSDWDPHKRVTDSDSDMDLGRRTSNRKAAITKRRGRPRKDDSESDVDFERRTSNRKGSTPRGRPKGRPKKGNSDSDTDFEWKTSNHKGSAPRGRPKKGVVRKMAKAEEVEKDVPMEEVEKDVPMEYPSVHVMLTQLDLVAADPRKGYDFVPVIVSFFSKYKDSMVPSSGDDKEHLELMGDKKGRRKSARLFSARKAEDSYWSDIIVSDYDDGHVSSDSGVRRSKRGLESKRGTKKKKMEEETPLDVSAPPPAAPPAPPITLFDMPTKPLASNMEDNLGTGPTALVLYFSSAEAIPSGAELNNIFKTYGPVMEGDTQISPKSRSARIVFCNRTDAEAAYSSAGKYSIFGPALLSYEISYLPPPQQLSQTSYAKPDFWFMGGASSDAPVQEYCTLKDWTKGPSV